MSQVSRRSVASGVAWSAPVVVVAAAAPMAAASGPVTLGPTATASGGTTVTLSVPVTGMAINASYTITIPAGGITNTVGNTTTWTLPDVTVIVYAGGEVAITLARNNAGKPGVTWTVSYTVTGAGSGSGSFTFVY